MKIKLDSGNFHWKILSAELGVISRKGYTVSLWPLYVLFSYLTLHFRWSCLTGPLKDFSIKVNAACQIISLAKSEKLGLFNLTNLMHVIAHLTFLETFLKYLFWVPQPLKKLRKNLPFTCVLRSFF